MKFFGEKLCGVLNHILVTHILLLVIKLYRRKFLHNIDWHIFQVVLTIGIGY